ncbi:MAG: site-specific DNA-methyltransferase [Candidatus Desantisbacteria bacterium]
MDKLKMQSPDMTNKNIECLAELFPNVVTEIRDESGAIRKAIDFDLLKQVLSKNIVEGDDERYRLDWPGKKASLLKANMPITKTLRPCREESVNFDTTENLYIEGDNFEVLKILQESYLGKVKMIYIDPPYNTGNDFIYKDDFSKSKEEYEGELGATDEDGGKLFRNTDSNGRFHSDWLSMMYERLVVARDLLKDDGVVFISIDDNEVHNLRKICDEVFGEHNFLGLFIINSTPNARDYGHIGKMHEFVLFYSKNIQLTTSNMLPIEDKIFKYSDTTGGYNIHPLYNSNEAFTNLNRPNLFYPFYLYTDEPIENDFYAIGLEKKANAVEIFPPQSVKNAVQFIWRWGKEKARENLNREIIGYKTENNEYRIVQKMRHNEKIIRSLLTETKYSSRRGTAEVEDILKGKIFSFPKPLSLLSDLCKVATDETSIVLDLFSGSATTAHAVMQLNAEDNGNRKFIMVQLPEKTDESSEAFKAGYKTIAEIGKERIRRAGKKIVEELKAKNQQLELAQEPVDASKIDIGFRVYKTDESNMKDVFYHPSKLKQAYLSSLESNIKEDRTPEDLLTQVILDLGLELTLPIETKKILGNTVFIVQTNALVACFDNDIDFKIVDTISDLKPFKVVFKDASFKDDKDRINVEERFKRLSPETKVTVI